MAFDDPSFWPRTFLRNQLKIRISKKKAIKLGQMIFED